jgi:hypothetical protein
MTTSRQRRKVMAKMTKEEWLKDIQENGDDGTGYCDYHCEGCHECAGKTEEEASE